MNASATFHCNSSSPVTWKFSTAFFPGNVVVVNATSLSIFHATKQNTGIYTCIGIQESKYKFYAEAKLMVVSQIWRNYVLPELNET